MMKEKQKLPEDSQTEATCPKCGFKFWHKIKDVLKQAGESLGDAIGEAKFGGGG
jgi:hypothetical protein